MKLRLLLVSLLAVAADLTVAAEVAAAADLQFAAGAAESAVSAEAAVAAESMGGENSPASLPDSVLNEEHVYKYLFTDRGLSERIMSELRRRGLLPAWELDYLEGDLYYNTGRCREALKFYGSALGSGHVSGDAALRMELLHRQISCYDALHDEAGRMRCVEALMALARNEGDEAMESIALFNLGKSLHYQGDRERGYDYMEQGARIMEASDYGLKYDNLRYEYKTLVMFYERDGRYDDVLRILDAWEAVVVGTTGEEDVIDGLAESELKDLYAQRTVALSHMGREEEAAGSYREFCALDEDLGRNSYLIMPYLFDTGRYDEIFRINLPRERRLVEMGDTVNYYMASVLKFLGYASRDIGDHRRASGYFERLAVLRDSLKYREQESAAQEYAALYESREKDLRIQREQKENQIAWTIAGALFLLTVAAGVFAVAIVRKNREINAKNSGLTASLDEMLAWKDEALRRQGELIALQEELAAAPPEAGSPRGGLPAGDADERLYERICYEVENRRLFLREGFDRDALAVEMNISPRRLARLFTAFAGRPFGEYLQDLRLAHSLTVMRDNPNWTIEAVAEACRMSLRTFHRQFTRKYSMTPQTYQKAEAARKEASGRR